MVKQPEYKWKKEVLDLCVKCKKCKLPILLVFDPTVRDRHDECGGKPIKYDKNLVRKK